MDNVINSTGQTFKTNFTNAQNKVNATKEPDKNNTKKKAAFVIGGTAALALATLGVVYAVKKMQPPKLKNIKFDHGIATRGGKKFTGTIKDVLKSGEKVELTYSDGIIQQSIKKNGDDVILKKTFEYGTKHGDVITTEDVVSGTKRYSRAKTEGSNFIREFFEIKDTRDVNEAEKLIKQTGRITTGEDGAIQISRIRRDGPNGAKKAFCVSGNLNDTVVHTDIKKGAYPMRHDVFDNSRHVVRLESDSKIKQDVAEKLAEGKAVVSKTQQFGK